MDRENLSRLRRREPGVAEVPGFAARAAQEGYPNVAVCSRRGLCRERPRAQPLNVMGGIGSTAENLKAALRR